MSELERTFDAEPAADAGQGHEYKEADQVAYQVLPVALPGGMLQPLQKDNIIYDVYHRFFLQN